MKKIFTLLTAAFASMSMMAANFQIYFGEEPVVDGATYTTKGYVLDEEASYEWKGTQYWAWEQDGDLFIDGTAGLSVVLEVASDNNMQACFGTLCQSVGPNRPATLAEKLTGSRESLRMHATYETTNDEDPALVIPTVTFTVTAYEAASPDAKTTFTVVMPNVNANAGISSAVAAAPYKMVGNTLHYNLDRAATLSIYSITGALAAKYNVANNGNLNLSNLPKGIYIYTDGRSKGKIIVR